MRRRIALIAVLAALIAQAAAGSANAGTFDTYVALGDSYSSGTGTRDYYHQGCQRSYYAYPWILQHNWPRHPPMSYGVSLYNFSCAGATTTDVINKQVPSIPAYATHITMSIGGNDANFSGVIKQCAKPWPTTCWGDINKAQDFIRNTLKYRLGAVMMKIRAKAPWAHVYLVGYPHLFGPQECNGAARISIGEQTKLNQTADMLRDVEAYMAAYAGRGFAFVDAIPLFRGHAICSGKQEWLNGLSNPTGESFHPNRNGHRYGYFPLVWSAVASG